MLRVPHAPSTVKQLHRTRAAGIISQTGQGSTAKPHCRLSFRFLGFVESVSENCSSLSPKARSCCTKTAQQALEKAFAIFSCPGGRKKERKKPPFHRQAALSCSPGSSSRSIKAVMAQRRLTSGFAHRKLSAASTRAKGLAIESVYRTEPPEMCYKVQFGEKHYTFR